MFEIVQSPSWGVEVGGVKGSLAPGDSRKAVSTALW